MGACPHCEVDVTVRAELVPPEEYADDVSMPDEGVTVGLVLHDIDQAARYADNLVALHDGVPYDWGPAGEVVSAALLAEVFGVDATVRTGDGRPPEILAHGPIEE